jgi:prevent-host-death family protein
MQAGLTNLTNLPERITMKVAEEASMSSSQVNLYEAKTQLSSLVDRAANGEEIIIAKAGKPMAKLVSLGQPVEETRRPGGNFLGVTYIADDFDAPLPDEVLRDFGMID